jgi:RimJ/RimL family protein N-acetyltransferase
MKPPAVVIRFARKADAQGFVDSWNESFKAGHLRYTGTQRRGKADVAGFRKRYSARHRTDFGLVAVVDDHTIVGMCDLFARGHGRTRHRAELGWMVRHDYAGRGIASALLRAALREAKRRGVKRVEAEIAVENIASVRLARKFGFRLEGRRAAGILLDTGRYLDTYLFGRVLK